MPYNKSFIDHASSVKMAGYWPRSLFAFSWTETKSRSIITQKENSPNIQPYWPRAWSIIIIYVFHWATADCSRSPFNVFIITEHFTTAMWTVVAGGRTQFSSACGTFKLFMVWHLFFARVKVSHRRVYSCILVKVCAVAMSTGLVKTRL